LDVGNAPETFGENATRLLRSVVDFFAYLHEKSPQFRDFATGSQFAQELFSVLFPVVCSSDTVSAETELNSKDSALTFDGGDVVIRPLNGSNTSLTPIVRTVIVDDHESPPIDGPRPPNQRSERLRRGSSFILVTAERPLYKPASAKISSNVTSPIIETMPELIDPTNSVVESLMDLAVSVFVDAILERREFNGFKAFNLVGGPSLSRHIRTKIFRYRLASKSIKYTSSRTCYGIPFRSSPPF
jgi:beige protein homolog 1